MRPIWTPPSRSVNIAPRNGKLDMRFLMGETFSQYLTELFGWWNNPNHAINESNATGAILHVSPDGDDSYTREQVLTGLYHWRTPQRATWGASNVDTGNDSTAIPSEAVQAGETVLVHPGVYQMQRFPSDHRRRVPSVRCANNGTPEAPIIVKAMYDAPLVDEEEWSILEHLPVEGADVDGLGGPMLGATGLSTGDGRGREWIVFRGFYIDEENAPAHRDGGVLGVWTSHHIAFRYNLIKSMTTPLYGNNRALTWIDGSQYIWIQNNMYPDHRTGGFNAGNSPCIEAYFTNNMMIEHNEVLVSEGAPYNIKGGDNSGIVVRRNKFIDTHVPAVHGIIVASDGGLKCYQNIWIGGNDPGVRHHTYNTFTGGSNCDVFNNIFYNTVSNFNGPVISYTGQEWFNGSENQVNNRFYNNIFANIQSGYIVGGDALDEAIFVEKNNLFEHNTYYNFHPNGLARFGGTVRNTSYWTNTLNKDTVSPSISTLDPMFMNPGENDFRLMLESPSLNAGRDIIGLWGSVGSSVNRGPYLTGNETIGLVR